MAHAASCNDPAAKLKKAPTISVLGGLFVRYRSELPTGRDQSAGGSLARLVISDVFPLARPGTGLCRHVRLTMPIDGTVGQVAAFAACKEGIVGAGVAAQGQGDQLTMSGRRTWRT